MGNIGIMDFRGNEGNIGNKGNKGNVDKIGN